jgi:hypothetical protein
MWEWWYTFKKGGFMNNSTADIIEIIFVIMAALSFVAAIPLTVTYWNYKSKKYHTYGTDLTFRRYLKDGVDKIFVENWAEIKAFFCRRNSSNKQPEYKEGWLAYQNLAKHSDNPYSEAKSDLWRLGWEDADKHHSSPYSGGWSWTDIEPYSAGTVIVVILTFLGSWGYCIAQYGYLMGVGFGWIPSIIVAIVAGFLWPLILVVVILALLFNR